MKIVIKVFPLEQRSKILKQIKERKEKCRAKVYIQYSYSTAQVWLAGGMG